MYSCNYSTDETQLFISIAIVIGPTPPGTGVIAPATSALLHNTSTLGISLKSMTNLLNEQEKRKEYEEAEA